jgi:hypothetical protein
LAHALTHALGQLEYIVIARATKAPRAVLDQVVPFTPAEHAALDPLIGRVFGKYAGGWLSKYEDEAALAIVLLTLTQQKIAGVAQIMQASRGPATVHSIDRSTPTPAIDVPADPAPESRE